jgi:hypothetical protein
MFTLSSSWGEASLCFERYFRGRELRWIEWSNAVRFCPTEKHDIRSISKSVTSFLIGMAVSENKLLRSIRWYRLLSRSAHVGKRGDHIPAPAHHVAWAAVG